MGYKQSFYSEGGGDDWDGDGDNDDGWEEYHFNLGREFTLDNVVTFGMWAIPTVAIGSSIIGGGAGALDYFKHNNITESIETAMSVGGIALGVSAFATLAGLVIWAHKSRTSGYAHGDDYE